MTKTIESAAHTLRRKLSSGAASTFSGPHLDADPVQLHEYLCSLIRQMVGEGKFADISHVEAVADWLTEYEDPKPWLLLTGNPGTGKTTMLRAIQHVLLIWGAEYKKFRASDLPTLFLDNAEVTRDQVLGGSWCRYLILDDVGTEPVSVKTYGNEIQPFVRIVEARYESRLPLIVTSNLSPGEFLDRYGLRTYDRMCELCETVTFDGQSFRTSNSNN